MKKILPWLKGILSEIGISNRKDEFIFGIGLIFFLSTLINISVLLHETRATKGMVYAKDNDAGRGIQTATLTRWWNSNHFAPYGNLYFRFAHTLAKLTPSTVEEKRHPQERDEMENHFALLVTSLLSLAALSYFLAYLLTESFGKAFWVSVILMRLGLLDSTWVEFLFRVHPEHTLMLFCAISTYFTMKYTNSNSRRDFILAAFFWGITTAVKRSTVLFIPSFLYLFLSEGFNKKSVQKGFAFAGFMLLAYLVVGFPQNFGFYKHMKFMYIETHNSIPATLESVTDYLRLIFKQSIWIWVALLGVHLFFGKQEKMLNKRFSLFVGIALVIVLSRNVFTAHNHHIMPHVAVFFVFALYLIKYIPPLKFNGAPIVFPVLMMVSFFLVKDSYRALNDGKENQLTCRPEIISIIKLVESYQSQSKRLVRDPYFPFSATYPGMTKQIWGNSGADLDKENATLWGTHRGFLTNLKTKAYRPFIYTDLQLSEWNDKLAFAELALTNKLLKTPSGKFYELILEDSCQYMVWKRKD